MREPNLKSISLMVGIPVCLNGCAYTLACPNMMFIFYKIDLVATSYWSPSPISTKLLRTR